MKPLCKFLSESVAMIETGRTFSKISFTLHDLVSCIFLDRSYYRKPEPEFVLSNCWINGSSYEDTEFIAALVNSTRQYMPDGTRGGASIIDVDIVAERTKFGSNYVHTFTFDGELHSFNYGNNLAKEIRDAGKSVDRYIDLMQELNR